MALTHLHGRQMASRPARLRLACLRRLSFSVDGARVGLPAAAWRGTDRNLVDPHLAPRSARGPFRRPARRIAHDRYRDRANDHRCDRGARRRTTSSEDRPSHPVACRPWEDLARSLDGKADRAGTNRGDRRVRNADSLPTMNVKVDATPDLAWASVPECPPSDRLVAAARLLIRKRCTKLRAESSPQATRRHRGG